MSGDLAALCGEVVDLLRPQVRAARDKAGADGASVSVKAGGTHQPFAVHLFARGGLTTGAVPSHLSVEHPVLGTVVAPVEVHVAIEDDER